MSQKEDVYETSDLPEDDQHTTREEAFESEHIERVHLDVDSAYKRFKGKTLNTDEVDFSDALIRRRRKGYGGGHYVLELIGTEQTGVAETAEQKFNRLHHEINELAQQIQDIKTETDKSDQEDRVVSELGANDIAGLQQQLKLLQVEQVLGHEANWDAADPHGSLTQKLSQSLDKLKTKEVAKTAQTESSSLVTYEINLQEGAQGTIAKTAELESRLARLETVVGSDTDKLSSLTGDHRTRGILDAVQVLQQKVQMLDANQLDALDARLTAVVHKLGQINEKKQQLDSDELQKVDETYDLLKKWDSFRAVLPDIVARMQALQQLHEQGIKFSSYNLQQRLSAIVFSQSLTQLDGAQQQLLKTLASDSDLLNEVKSSLAENLTQMQSNCESIEKRIKALSN